MTTDKKPAVQVPLLTTYYMYITGGCNLACRHCWISPNDAVSGDCLDFGLFKTAVDEGIPLGLSQIKFTGGEPLLHPDFVKMADYAAEKKIRTWLETNGTLLTRELALHLKTKTTLNMISVSIDGASAKTHDDFRNQVGSFERAWQGVEWLVAAGYKPQVIMSLFKENREEIVPLVRLAFSRGCGSVKFNIIQSSGRGEQMKTNEELLSIKELVDLGGWIEKELQKEFPIPLLFSWPMAFHGIKRLHIDRGANCNVFNILGILSSGEVALCGIGTQEKELIYGRLGKDKISDIWEKSPGLKKIRDLIPNELDGVCNRCIFRKRCLGSCIAQNFHSSRRLTAPFWFCEQADQQELFPQNRCLTNKKKQL